ncbi:DNA-methyltransferase [Actinomadura viridis]|uniref:DNA-methyltransferase n=1 Tax=Actinomadura viridis TaxID=58110 RepID=UPI0036BAE13E
MSASIIRADARRLPLPDESVDLIVTSPPYWGLRSYTDGGRHYDGQIGAEPTPGEYVDALIECTREWMRVLKPEGSLWVNIGDVYYSGKGAPGRTTRDDKSEARTFRRAGGNPLDGPSFGVGRKSLVGMPWRYALRSIDDLGLILRAEVVWSKVNGLPESVTDRVRRSHEQWFHLVKQPLYYSAVDAIREPHKMKPQRRPNGHKSRQQLGVLPAQTYSTSQRDEKGVDGHPLGALPGSVWEVATQPLRVPPGLEVEHFAAFPPALIRRIILGWSPPGVCTACGEGRQPAADRSRTDDRPGRVQGRMRDALLGGHGKDGRAGNRYRASVSITGYVCACPEPTAPIKPAIVLDPFGGTGTTALVADVHGRHGISVDMSADYCRLAQWRTADRGERARALGVPKPPPVPDRQDALFEEIA